ncbi:MAG TPA: LemA family protein [Chitinophagaceae bacterium]|jgi:LemA protein|nr:LemA family protein [Chitinophagaceae bacterium]
MPKKKFSGLLVGGLILFLLILYMVVAYNSLVKKEENVKQKWSEVQNTYQRRLDLIPNLVNVVKGVSGFEQSTLEKIAEMRSKAIAGMSNDELNAGNYQNQRTLQDSLAAAANRIIVLVEKYPVLKGTAAYAGLQAQLEGTERRIKVARNDFNESVATYNKAVRNFPSNMVSGVFGFKVKEGFEAVAGSEKAVEIKF